MKKILSLLLVILILGCFVGCDSIPEGMPEHTYKLGVEALDVTDQYLDLKITKDEAKNRLDELLDRINSLDNGDLQTNFIWTDINSICWELVQLDSSDMEIITLRNRLAETLGKTIRNY